MERYEEKRKYPRIILDCKGRLLVPGDQTIEVLIHDISPGGVQIRCDKQSAQILKTENDRATFDFEMTFILSLYEEKMNITLRCRLVYMVNMDESLNVAGMQFTNMDRSNRKSLKRFIESSMEPL